MASIFLFLLICLLAVLQLRSAHAFTQHEKIQIQPIIIRQSPSPSNYMLASPIRSTLLTSASRARRDKSPWMEKVHVPCLQQSSSDANDSDNNITERDDGSNDEYTSDDRPASIVNDGGKKSFLGRFKAYFAPEKKDNDLTFKQRLAKMGVATVLSYGMISNLSYAVLVAISWYAFAAQTGKSPLAPGQWKPFLGVYAGFWMFNNIVRPLRLGLSIAIAPSLDNVVLFFQNRLKISKPVAITVTVVVVNVIGTTVLMCGGIAAASLLARVPIFPSKSLV